MSEEIKKRIKRVVLVTALFVCTGLLYALCVILFHGGIPCLFHNITGLKCPGCGMTHAMIALLKFDFHMFITSNLFAPVILFFLIVAWISTSLKYIQTGVYRLFAVNSFIELSFLVLFLAWGIIRNCIGI